MNIERVILSNLLFNDEYNRKVIAFLELDYFQNYSEKVIYNLIKDYVNNYNSFPSIEALAIDLSNKDGLNEDVFKEATDIISSLEVNKDTKLDWLLDQTEKWCQDRALYLAIMESIRIMDEKNGSISKGSIPQLLTDALGVSFDSRIGHDYINDLDQRYEFYHLKEERIPFDIDYFNKITDGGLPRKTLNVLLAGTNVGKSLFMCHMAANNLTQGKNVLYITLEMAEERIAERIDANLLDIPINELKIIPKDTFVNRLNKLRAKTPGTLIIKEYPTSSAGSANFRHLLNELKIKKEFIPDIIYIDYLNICMSSRIRMGANVNSYTYIKAIAEELRGLAVEFNVPILSATQTTRSGYSNSDVELTDTSESFALPATVDLMVALISSEELYALNQIMVKQLKNRYADPGINKRFVVGVDRPKMRLYDVDEQGDVMDDRPVMDKGKFMEEENERKKPKAKFDRKKLEGFK